VLRLPVAGSEGANNDGVMRLRRLKAILGLGGADAMIVGICESGVVKEEEKRPPEKKGSKGRLRRLSRR
jgi:hypothetical protein